MSIRKREWENKDGTVKTSWVYDYFDGAGKRRLKTFKRKSDAENYAASTRIQINEGTHVPESTSITVAEAADLWLQRCTREGLEPRTLVQYRQHVNLHIAPFIGRKKLVHVSTPLVRAFMDQLHDAGRSPQMVAGVTGSLGAILTEAIERGLAIRNPVRELRRHRKRRGHNDARHKPRLEVGVDIPTPEEIREILQNAKDGRHQMLLMTAALTGLRASELRGLRWSDVDLEASELHVRQRADADNRLGSPKSETARRTIPLPPILTQELRKWKLKQPKPAKKSGLVFCNDSGNVEALGNIVKRGLHPACLRAGIHLPVLDKDGKQERDEKGHLMWKPKYTGLHAFRHFYASWCINRKQDGGLQLPLKVVQERMGHSSVTMTADRYGHLFPRGDDGGELAEAEAALLDL